MQKQKKSSKCSKRKNFKIYWDRVAMVAMVPILAVGLYSATFPSNVVEFEEREIIVQNGDTLWTIAKDAVGETEDVRQTIREIMTTNKLQDGTIHPGMTLRVRAIKE
ncbi:LysM peptidoglycan-binding domain-containing protein [Veillonella sp. VA137]|uniref:LysM peptidoglycan-binding domain-containing protein n=1 Tax=Veillonella sp. VA137 TaxID=741828 RepID=UPI0013DEA4EF|nr:LysM peptidoglycan-binding domain-containing protein [Veillonella sp. VA137]